MPIKTYHHFLCKLFSRLRSQNSQNALGRANQQSQSTQVSLGDHVRNSSQRKSTSISNVNTISTSTLPPLFRIFNKSLCTSSIVEQRVTEGQVHISPELEDFNYDTFEEHLFQVLSNEDGQVPVSRILKAFKSAGLWSTDPRLAENMMALRRMISSEMVQYGDDEGISAVLDKSQFKACMKHNIALIKKAFTGEFVIPEFGQFCTKIEDLYKTCKENTSGLVASYIPQLLKSSPELWGVSLCTIDGQRYCIGDVAVPFTIQSASKPFNYALAVKELGSEEVHSFVGHEPSGEAFNSIKLSPENKPHNPLINAGAILIASMIKSELKLADRFDYIQKEYGKLAGGEDIGFNNSVFLSEKECANRNYALAYYMKENNCFPPGASMEQAMDFYFMMCAIEMTANTAAVLAATLANGGYCPITDEQVLSSTSVRNTLALMHSCGMYDYSGGFAFKVGLPAKSSVSGAIILVIPNVAGFCLYSPRLDQIGNSSRGVQFCEQLVKQFNFHHYDNLLRHTKKLDPRQRQIEHQGAQVVNLLFGAFNGDRNTLRRLALLGQNMELADYDGRTALHLAAAEGHMDCVRFLVNKCRVKTNVQDRWGNTPAIDASKFGHDEVVDYLRQCTD